MDSKVYFIPALGQEDPESLSEKSVKLFKALNIGDMIERESFVALKIHFGEKKNAGYIKPHWLSGVINQVRKRTSRAFFSDTNTLYVGNRSNSIEHIRLAREHGFSLEATGIPVLIADGLIGRDDDEILVDLPRIKTAKIASAYLNTDVLLCLTHFTGHLLTGFGAAIKNLGMGCASRAGKLEQHADVHPSIDPEVCTNCGICLDYCSADAIEQTDESAFIMDEKCIGCGECLVVCNTGAVKMRWDEDSIRVQEKMAEYAYSLYKRFQGKIAFLNFLIYVTKDCDCMSQKGKIIVDDIGILGSFDPVALDKASVDLILEKSGKDVLRAEYDVDWKVQLEHGAEIGLGSLDYRLIPLT
jgi:uncharacterized Fe-S center protein